MFTTLLFTTPHHTTMSDAESDAKNGTKTDAKRKHDDEEAGEGSEDEWIGPRPEEAAPLHNVKKIKGKASKSQH